jgi:hypothetical protein
MWGDMSDFDQLLQRANPLTPEDAHSFESTHGFDDLFDGIVASDPTEPRVLEPTRRRRSRRALLSIGLAATLIVGGATAAAAGWTSVHTGTFGHRGDTEDVPGEEFLDVGADAMPQLAARLGKNIPFPPGDDVHAYIPMVTRGGGFMQATGIRGTLTSDSLCAWWGYWLQSHEAGDATEQARATAILEAAPTWPIVVKTDGGGTVTFYEQIAAAAQNGQPALIEQAVKASCTTLPRRWANK